MTYRIAFPLRTAFFILLAAVFIAIALSPGKTLAHNEYVESSPAEDAELSTTPDFWDITFTKDVPLDSASGEIISANGVRTALATPIHGATTNVIRFSLPSDAIGPLTARWKLVSEDGHVVQGRVNFQVLASGQASDSQVNGSQQGATSTPSDNVVENSVSTASITNPAPEPVRWAVRSLSFAAIMLIGGLLFVERALSITTNGSARGVLFTRTSSITLAVAPFLQNLFLVGDIRNTNIFSALPHFFSTFDLTYGAMLITQTVIGLAVIYMFWTSRNNPIMRVHQHLLIALFGMYLIALAFSGHSRTMAWPVLGIPADIVHTAAAAAWLGGLATLAFLVIPQASVSQAVSTYKQFGFFARYAVIAIVVTGVIQTLRLHGDIVSLFTESHGRVLLLKIAVVIAMLKVGDINRKRLLRRLDPDAPATEKRISLLWRASMTEITTGGIVIAVTAVLVTSSFS